MAHDPHAGPRSFMLSRPELDQLFEHATHLVSDSIESATQLGESILDDYDMDFGFMSERSQAPRGA